ncbi:hypothetical protein KSP39_PZI010513 [Platanthera zijinensis]|uniref:MULE transposase domain-containing protein n=1 Tax=Platanthera zijinensis TaxID=2320716 RepID=A0AAP0BK78_9ASPA
MKFTWPHEFYTENSLPSKTILPRFQRIYICLPACRESFRVCRPIVGLDGCFLKGYYGGQLLTAIGRDPNDQMLPIAYAVVEAENKDSWSCFLTHLTNDIGMSGITYIFDQQKGLVQVFKELLPGVDHRFCVRHLYNNFRKKISSKNLKCLLWKASNATFEEEWSTSMNEIREISVKAYDHLLAIERSLWCKHSFGSRPKCDVVVNNMTEAFNRVILDMREKPILTMLEDIRVYLMSRWANNRQRIEKQISEVNIKIAKKLDDEAKLSGL